MCREIAEVVECVEEGRVFTVEEGGIWFSGMNAHVGRLVSQVADALRVAGYQVGLSFSQDGGIVLQVPDAEEMENEKLDEVVCLLGSEPRADEEVVQ
jgi:hypothetical protein